jgi:hypothetical protein
MLLGMQRNYTNVTKRSMYRNILESVLFHTKITALKGRAYKGVKYIRAMKTADHNHFASIFGPFAKKSCKNSHGKYLHAFIYCIIYLFSRSQVTKYLSDQCFKQKSQRKSNTRFMPNTLCKSYDLKEN